MSLGGFRKSLADRILELGTLREDVPMVAVKEHGVPFRGSRGGRTVSARIPIPEASFSICIGCIG